MVSETRIRGLADLDRAMKELPAKIEANILRGALRAGQTVIAEAAKNNLQANDSVDSGDLLKSVRVRFKARSLKKGWVRTDLVAGNKAAWYAHLVEFGTGSFYTGKGKSVRAPYEIKPKNRKSLFFAGIARELVVHPGAKPKPFMRPAVDASQDAAIERVVEYIRKRLPREIAKVQR